MNKVRHFFLFYLRKYCFLASDFFYPLVSYLFPLQLFRYAFFGLLNLGFDTLLFLTAYYVVFTSWKEVDLPLIDFTMGLHTFCLLVTMPISMMTGFLIMRYIVFYGARKEGLYRQLFHYVFASFSSLILNYIFLKLFVEIFILNVFLSKILTSGLVVIYGFFFQTRITFKK